MARRARYQQNPTISPKAFSPTARQVAALSFRQMKAGLGRMVVAWRGKVAETREIAACLVILAFWEPKVYNIEVSSVPTLKNLARFWHELGEVKDGQEALVQHAYFLIRGSR
jgi:hypothetical protein